MTYSYRQQHIRMIVLYLKGDIPFSAVLESANEYGRKCGYIPGESEEDWRIAKETANI